LAQGLTHLFYAFNRALCNMMFFATLLCLTSGALVHSEGPDMPKVDADTLRESLQQVDRRLAELTQSPEKLQATLQASPMIQELAKREPQVAADLKDLKRMEKEMGILQDARKEVQAKLKALEDPAVMAEAVSRTQAVMDKMSAMRAKVLQEMAEGASLEQQSSFVEVEGESRGVAPLLEMLLPRADGFQAPALATARASGVLRSEPAMMANLNRKVVSFDADGVFEGREKSVEKDPVKILTRVNELRVLTNIANAGLLSGAEEAGVFSKLEKAGAFSAAEKVLPVLDDLGALSVAESLLNVPANLLAIGGAALLLGDAALVTVVPDDSTALIALQVLTSVLAGAGSVTLFATSFLFSLLQGEDPGR